MKIDEKSLMRTFITSFLIVCCTFPLCAQPVGGKQSGFIRFGKTKEALNHVQRFLPVDPIIIDAGAYVGNESEIMAKKWPRGHVHAFEPIPEIFQTLFKRANQNQNITAYQLALGASDGLVEIFVSEKNGKVGACSSLLAPSEVSTYAPAVTFPSVINVQVYKLDTWAKMNKIKRVDMLWLDMQGVELNVIKASPTMLKTTKVIITEVEFIEAYKGQHLYEDVKSYLEAQGFILIGGNFDPDQPQKNGRWYGDALFIRKELLNRL